ncbi:MAG: efflux transporter periplasmic adaptor subunit [Deltaproteobacteria bacterium]|nr:MAG: efflux transporter periplasmic adaptor subunit [Deltaproteobacteria bacterium]
MQLNENLNQSLKKPAIVLMVLLCSLLLTACDRSTQSPVPSPPVPEVATVTVQPQKSMLATELPGRTAAFRVAEIRPQVSGLILKRLFKEGSDVKAGQVLYQIDPAPFQAALDNAEAALARAESNLPPVRLRAERYKELLTDKAVSRQDYDDAAAALKQARAEINYWKAQVKTARINLGYTRITAPISGRIGKSDVTEGAIVTAYQPTPLAAIHQLDPIYVDVPQFTAELLRLKRRLQNGNLHHGGADQAKVKLILEDATVYPHEGTLQFRDVSVDPTTGSVILRMIFPNPERVLLPKMFVRAVIKEGVKEDAILVPQQAVFRNRKGEPFTLIVDAEGKVAQRKLTLDRAIGDRWLVVSGVSAGDRVIVEGLQFVRPGMPVKATSRGKDKAAKGAWNGDGAGQNTISEGGA